MEAITAKVYIYALRDPRSKEVRYIGSAEKPRIRFSIHRSNPQTPALKAWMSELRGMWLAPMMDILEETTTTERHTREWHWIQKFRSEGRLLNADHVFHVDEEVVVAVHHTSVDTPLRRWRLQEGLSREEFAQRLGVSIHTLTSWEQGRRTPYGERLDRVVQETGLDTRAVALPEQYLSEYPDFLGQYAERDQRKGRPPRQS